MEQGERQKQREAMDEWAALWYLLDDDDKRILYGVALTKLYPRRRWKDLEKIDHLHILG